MNIRSVAVIGAGAMGRRLAARFAAAGFDTTLEDVLPSNLRRAAEFLSTMGLTPEGGENSKLRFADSVEDAVRNANLIVDCVPDELESKLEIFSMMDRMAPPRAIFVTPTRSLSIADLASCTYRADRCIAAEFASPDLLAGEEVSLVSTSWTSPEVLEAVAHFWTVSGFTVEQKMDPAEASVTEGTLF
jgi:3-hydroxybutyryl-CoA dehydrogenase